MEHNRKLPLRRARILEFIGEFLEENGLPPTVRDIQHACNISSTSVVDYNLRLLQRDGFLRRRPDVARGIELLDETASPRRGTSALRRIPVIAYIAAGEPLPLVDNVGWTSGDVLENIEISSDWLGSHQNLYALKVKGQSMIDALVDDGDIVLVEPTEQAPNGAMVVARLRLENETTLKHLYQEGDTVRLQPANTQMSPIFAPADNVEVQGRVIGVIRMIR